MGYEMLEKDSLITLKIVIEGYIRSVKKYIEKKYIKQSQGYKDAVYELDRINSELNIRY